MSFDPFSSGAATEVHSEPGQASQPKPNSFDPFASGAATAQTDTPKDDGEQANAEGWKVLYGGIDQLDATLPDEQKKAFARLDSVSENPKESRAQVINEAYLGSKMKLSPSYIHQNYDAISTAYAKEQFGIVSKSVPATGLYGLIAGRVNPENEPETGEIKPWTISDRLGGDLFETKRAIGNFWQGINKPIVKLPDAPHDLPDFRALGMYNPAVIGGAFNGLKPILEGVGSPLGLATLGVGSELRVAAKTYPLAKVALVAMEGVITGLMGWQTAKAVIKVPAVFKDPNSTLQDRVQAVMGIVADGGATLLGTVGIALDLVPKAKLPPLLKQLEGKNPAEAAQVLRNEAQTTDVPGHSDFLNDAAHELERIATTEHLQGVKEGEKAEKQAPQPASEEKAKESKETPISKGPIGIKNEAIDEELGKMGLPPATHGEKLSHKEAMESASAVLKENPGAGSELVDSLDETPRPVTGKEDALLLQELNTRRIARDRAQASGDRVAIAQAREAFQKASDVVTRVGTENAIGLALRRMMVNEDYSLAAMESRAKAAKGSDLTPEELSQVSELSKKLSEAQAKIDAYEQQRRQAALEPVREAPRRPKPPGKVTRFISEQAKAARGRILERAKGQRVMDVTDIPSAVGDLAIVGAEYIANGVRDFGEWSKAMANEFGETIRPYLQDIFRQSIEARDRATKLQAYKTRVVKGTEALQKKLAEGDFTKAERKPLPLDKEALRLKADYERVKRQVTVGEMELEAANRTTFQKVRDGFQKWVRLGALSYPTVFVKLTAAAASRFVFTPMEQAVGYGLTKVLPKSLTSRARFEAVPTLGGAIRAESKAIVDGWIAGIKGSGQMILNKDTDLQALLDKEHVPPELIDYLGKLHGAFKYPAQLADYQRRLQLVTEADMRAGVDVTDPVQQMRLMHEAWTYSKRSIFLQDNGVVNAYKAAIKSLEAKQKSTGQPSLALQILSTGIQAELPIVKVPTNVMAEVSEAVTGSLQGPARAAWAYAKGIENLKPGEADAILRLMKKGSLGAAFVALGYFKAKQFGGFYQKGEKRDKKDVPAGGVRVDGADLPQQVNENAYLQAAEFGATISRVSGMLVKKTGGNPKGPLTGVVAAVIGALDEVPFVRETSEMEKFSNPSEFFSAADQKAASVLIPGIFQFTAAQLDKRHPFSPSESATPRKVQGLGDAVKKDVPVLRETLPKRDVNTSLRTP